MTEGAVRGTADANDLPTPQSTPHGYDVSAWCRACQHTVARLVPGSGGRHPAGKAELLSGVEGVSSRPVWKIVLRDG